MILGIGRHCLLRADTAQFYQLTNRVTRCPDCTAATVPSATVIISTVSKRLPEGALPVHFQELILRLQNYWAAQDCVILQPYDLEVGAGTFHTATFLAAIGPEPLRAAYVQPSRRPTDGRYGENPNRLQHYFQFQVVLKPSPDDFQQRYLGSLETLGIDFLRDDIRFVEDDWESPTLGAWGLGWEVWLKRDGGISIHIFPAGRRVGLPSGHR